MGWGVREGANEKLLLKKCPALSTTYFVFNLREPAPNLFVKFQIQKQWRGRREWRSNVQTTER